MLSTSHPKENASHISITERYIMEESLPPLGIHIEEEVDIAEILGGPPSEDPGDSPDEGEPEEPELV